MVNRFLTKRKFNYQTLVGGSELVKQMSITSYPTHLIVNAGGEIVDVIQYGSETIGITIEKVIKSNLK